MPFTAVAKRSTINLARVKSHLRIEQEFVDHDEEIKRFLRAAKEEADAFLINPFTSNGLSTGSSQPIPDTVEVWLLARVAQMYEWRILGQKFETINGVGSASVELAPDYTQMSHLRDPAGRVGF